MSFLQIRRAGLLTTIQDEGRWGYQDRGVSVAGPMDAYSHRLANLLVGNDAAAATLEVTSSGPEIEFEESAIFAVTGAAFDLTLDGIHVPMNRMASAQAGSCLDFHQRSRAARAYIGVAGGILVPTLLGSRSTHVLSRMGGVNGRPLQAGDRLETGEPYDLSSRFHRQRPAAMVLPDGGARIRAIPGPHSARFSEATIASLEKARYRLSMRCDRMGYQLEGPPLQCLTGEELISDAMPVGGLQVPPSGQPILLMADRATTGGYPIIATVITADLPAAGQLLPGDWIEFAFCSLEQARMALRQQTQALNGV